MNGATSGNADDLPDSILEEAAIWHGRMREARAGRDAARLAAFEAWLSADPRHDQAFRDTERLWDALEEPAATLLAETARDATPRGRAATGRRFRLPAFSLPGATAAAGVLLAVAAGLFWQHDLAIRLESDYATSVGQNAPVVLEDGSRITLNTDSAVAVDFSAGRRQVRLLKGEAWFDVVPDKARPFIVTMSPGSVRVTGTRFNVRLDGGQATVSLMEGRVELNAPGASVKPPVVLAPGQQAKLSQAGISAPEPFDPTAVTAWLRGQFVFYAVPLSDVVAALNRYRSGRIVIANAALRRLTVSGVFRTDDPDAALAAIAATLPVHVLRLTDYLVLLR